MTFSLFNRESGSIMAVLPVWVLLEVMNAHGVKQHMVLYKAEVADISGFVYAVLAVDADCNNSLRANEG